MMNFDHPSKVKRSSIQNTWALKQTTLGLPLSVQTRMIVWENTLENWHFASSKKKSSRIQCWHFNEKLTAGVSYISGDFLCDVHCSHTSFSGFCPMLLVCSENPLQRRQGPACTLPTGQSQLPGCAHSSDCG